MPHEPGDKYQGDNPGPNTNRQPKKRPVALLVYVVYLIAVIAAVEGASRFMAARSQNQELRRVLYDHARLAKNDVSQFRFVPDGELPYRLRPDFELVSGNGHFVTRHNSAGFRDDEYSPKSEGTLRIICLGGSTTYGVSVDDNSMTYPARLEELLNGGYRPAGWERVEVFNHGVGGYTSREVLLTLEHHSLSLEPDVVLIQSAVNDVAPRFYPHFAADYSHFRKALEPLQTGLPARMAFRSRLVVIAGWQLGFLSPLTLQARSQYPMPSVSECVRNLEQNGTEAYRDHLLQAIRLARTSGARVWLLTQAHMFGAAFQAPREDLRLLDEAYRRGLEEHNDLIRELAASQADGLIDLDRSMPVSMKFFSDPVHMTEEGNRTKARLIAEVLQPDLPAPNAPRP